MSSLSLPDMSGWRSSHGSGAHADAADYYADGAAPIASWALIHLSSRRSAHLRPRSRDQRRLLLRELLRTSGRVVGKGSGEAEHLGERLVALGRPARQASDQLSQAHPLDLPDHCAELGE